MHRPPRTIVAIAVATMLASAGVATATTTPPDGEQAVVVVETVPGPAPDVAAVPPTVVARPTPFVVAQHLVELEGGRALQWQVTPRQLGAEAAELDATANLFVFADDVLMLSSASPPVGSAVLAPDEVAAVPTGSRWTLRAPAGGTAVTIFGLGHQEGGTAPAGAPFTLDAGGWYELEVRGYQLLPGESVEVGDDTLATLLLVRQGAIGVRGDQFDAGSTLSAARTTVANAGGGIAAFLAATVTPVPGDGIQAPPAAPPQTAAPQGTSAPSAPTSPPVTDAPTTTTEAPRAPTAVNDSTSLRDGRALIDANGSAVITMNVMSNDDRGNPQAVVVSVDGSESKVGEMYNNGGPANFRLDADGTATYSTSFHNPVYSVAYSVQYEIENEHGRSMAVASFEIFFCPEGGGSAC